MGSDLPEKASDALTFVVWALKDPESGNLDRVQIIKGFINKWGRADEKIYDVVWSDEDKRQIDKETGKPVVQPGLRRHLEAGDHLLHAIGARRGAPTPVQQRHLAGLLPDSQPALPVSAIRGDRARAPVHDLGFHGR